MRISILLVLTLMAGCVNLSSDTIEVLSSNQNTVTLLGHGAQRVLKVADENCQKFGKSARLVREWGGTRIERSNWQFDCI